MTSSPPSISHESFSILPARVHRPGRGGGFVRDFFAYILAHRPEKFDCRRKLFFPAEKGAGKENLAAAGSRFVLKKT